MVGAERRDIAGPETADGFGHELEFRDRHQIERAQLVFAAFASAASKLRIVSSASPKKSSRTGMSMPGG